MRGYLLDTNHLSHAIRVISPLRERLRQAHRQGYRLITCWPVLCELQEGIIFTANPRQYLRTLKVLMKEVRIWPMDWNLIEQYGNCAKLARERGRVLSTTDLILAAFAWKESTVILTTDKDFEVFPEIRTENWVSRT
jgi:predicted nucleic acid-binding protein